MLVEQIIELQLRGPGPPGRTYTPITDYFHDKTKISKENIRVDYYLQYCLNVARNNAPYFPLPGPNHLQLKFTRSLYSGVKTFQTARLTSNSLIKASISKSCPNKGMLVLYFCAVYSTLSCSRDCQCDEV